MKRGAYRIPVSKGYQQTALAGSLFIFEKWFVPRCSYTIDSRAIWAKGTRFSW